MTSWRRLSRGWLERWSQGPSPAGSEQAADAVRIDARSGYRLWARDYGLRPNAFQRLEADALSRLLPALEGRRVVDLGCGPGRLAALARARGARSVVGVDSVLAMALRFPAGRVAVADLAELPLRSRSFEVALAGLCFGHSAHLSRVVEEAARILRPGGSLVVSDFHPEATLAGMERTFVDPASGQAHALEQYAHPLAEYRVALARCGLRLEERAERSHRGRKVVLVLRARKI